MRNQSQTDWERLEQMTDEDIDTSDIPPLDEAFFANAKLRLPARKVPITIRLDPDVLDWFRSFGKGYQTHMNNVLRMYMETQEKQMK
ncbi:MAG: BrnA antitoxin family protein [Anaerolineae bacterium]|nr:BrnA antitoxin family protein [Anaerolineae bacterium]